MFPENIKAKTIKKVNKVITYTRKNVLMISLVISIAIFLCLDFLNNKIIAYRSENISTQKEMKSSDVEYNLNSKSEDLINLDKSLDWKIEIPKINLVAPISEGIDEDTLNKYVGHFPTTSVDSGNIGLAGHNRGYQKNYFARLKELQIGDLIIYKKDGVERKYKVDVITVIDDTNWSYLEATLDNRITLITCVENKPTKRRCIQGVEIVQQI